MYAPEAPAYGPVERMVDQLFAQQERRRLEQFATQWRYYHGDHKKPLKVSRDGSDDNVRVNKCRTLSDKTVAFLFGQPVTFVMPEQEDAKADDNAPNQAQGWLDGCWKANRQDAFLLGLGITGAVNGHAFVKLMPPKPGEKYPRLVNLDPASVYPSWDPHDLRDVTGWTIQYTGIDTRQESPSRGRKVVYRQVITRLPSGQGWSIVDSESLADSVRWVETGRSLWPYPFGPIAHCQNLPNPNEFWGIADLELDLISLNDARNFLLSNMQRIVRYHAHPKTVAKGVTPTKDKDGNNTLDVTPDGVIVLRGDNSELKNLEMQSDLASSLTLDARIDEGIHEQGRVPPISVGKLEAIGRLSGTAIGLLYAPLAEKTAVKRVLYGDDGLLGDVNTALLAMGGFAASEKPTTTWPELLPTDILEERQALLLDQQMGVASHQTIAEKLDYDWDQEQERLAEEAQNLGSTLLDQMASGTALGAGQMQAQDRRLAAPVPTLGERGGASKGGGQNG